MTELHTKYESSAHLDDDSQKKVKKAHQVAVEDEHPQTKRLGIKEFIFVLILIFLIWAGQRFFGS